MPLYEIFCIANASSTPAALTKLLQNTVKTVNRTGGVLRRVDNLGIRVLAARTKAHNAQHDYGRYLRLAVQISPPGLREVEHRLRVDEGVLRTTTFKSKMAPKHDPLAPKAPSSSGKTRMSVWICVCVCVCMCMCGPPCAGAL
jgi:ribosomal protein S6